MRLQAAQINHFSDYHFQRYVIHVDPAKVAVTDLFRPEFWVNGSPKLKVLDRIRVKATDDSWDFELTVLGKPEVGRGVIVGLWPRYPGGMTAEELAKAGDMVKSQLVASSVNGKPVPRVEPDGREGWRVIDIAGEIASRNHRSEADANVAMAKYISQLGIKTVVEPRPPEAKAEPAKAAAPKTKAAA